MLLTLVVDDSLEHEIFSNSAELMESQAEHGLYLNSLEAGDPINTSQSNSLEVGNPINVSQ